MHKFLMCIRRLITAICASLSQRKAMIPSPAKNLKNSVHRFSMRSWEAASRLTRLTLSTTMLPKLTASLRLITMSLDLQSWQFSRSGRTTLSPKPIAWYLSVMLWLISISRWQFWVMCLCGWFTCKIKTPKWTKPFKCSTWSPWKCCPKIEKIPGISSTGSSIKPIRKNKGMINDVNR